jgi:hypothetical protein
MKHNKTTLKTPYRCDCVREKKEGQAQYYEATKHMTREEERDYSRKLFDEFWASLERLRAEQENS